MKNCISLVLLFFCYNLYSQDYTQNQRVWFAYTGQYKVSNHWGYHIEAQFRMDNELQQSIQSLFRAGGIYYLSSSKMISGGYALVNTYSSLFVLPNDFPIGNDELYCFYSRAISYYTDIVPKNDSL